MNPTVRDLGPDDAPAVADLMARIESDHPTGLCLSGDEVAELMRDKPGCVFEGAFAGGDLVGFTTVLPSQPNADGQRFLLFGDVDPDRLGEGIGSLMLTRSLERARAIHRVDAPAAPARYAGAALADRHDQAELMRAAGLVPGRHSFLMVAELDEHLPGLQPVPSGLVVEVLDDQTAELRAHEHLAAYNAAFADYPDGTDLDAEFWGGFMVSASHNRHALSQVARDDRGSIVGFVYAHEYAVAMSGAEGREVYVPYVGTLPAHRGRGLATALLGRVLHDARAAGCVRAALNVDTANPTGALGIYERAGFRQSYRQDFYHLDEPPGA